MEQVGQFITHHWGLWFALIAVLLLIFINEYISQKKRAKELSPAAAVEMMNHNNAIVIDLRDVDAFRAGHIVDAVRASADDFNLPKMDKYKEKAIILVCARGLQAATVATKLRQQGFTEPMVLAGGIAAWQAASLPLVKGKTKG